MIAILAAISAGTLAAALPPPFCAAWGPMINDGLTVAKRCVDDDGQALDPLIMTRQNVADFTSGRWAGLVIDAATLKVASGPVLEGGELLRIKVRQGYAARLTSKFVGRGMGGASLKAGELVYGVSMRQSVSSQRPGQHAYELPMSGMVYLFCAPVRMTSGAPEIDRGMCFFESREKSKFGLFPGIKLNMDNQYTLALSGKGEAAHAPRSLEMAATMGVSKPKVEAYDRPYPEAFDLVVTWSWRDGRRILQADALDTAGSSAVLDVAMDDLGATVFGGQLRVEISPNGLTPRFERPIVDGAIVDFRIDQTTH